MFSLSGLRRKRADSEACHAVFYFPTWWQSSPVFATSALSLRKLLLCIGPQPLSVWRKNQGTSQNTKGCKIEEFVRWQEKYFIVELSEKLCSLLANLLLVLFHFWAQIGSGIHV